MKSKNKLLISTIVLFALSIIFTLLIIFVDKQNIGANNSSVGLSGLNNIFLEWFSFNEIFYKLTEIFGIVILAIAMCYMILAFVQLIKRKSIKKIDCELLILALFYVGLIIIYLIFELAKINFRPVLLDGELEASYPSSHTLLAVFICTTSIFVNNKIFSNRHIRIILSTATCLIGIFVIIGRIISGVHWITDIIGAILIATTLVLGYLTVLSFIKEKNTNNITSNHINDKNN